MYTNVEGFLSSWKQQIPAAKLTCGYMTGITTHRCTGTLANGRSVRPEKASHDAGRSRGSVGKGEHRGSTFVDVSLY